MPRTTSVTGRLAATVAAGVPAHAAAARSRVRGTVVRFSGNDVHAD